MGRRSFVLRWGWLLALWLLLAGTVSVGEVLAGAVAATVGVAVWAAVLPARDGPSPWRVVRWSRVPGQVLADVGVVIRVLVQGAVGRPVGGALQRVSFAAGAGRPARAVLAVVALSLPPNSYVVDIDPDEGMLVVHQLDPHAAGSDTVLRA